MNSMEVNESVGKVAVLMREPAVRRIILNEIFKSQGWIGKIFLCVFMNEVVKQQYK